MNNTIGATVAVDAQNVIINPANVISANGGDGIYITDASSNNIQGNFIGLNKAADKTMPLGNSKNGILLDGAGTTNNKIKESWIAYNGGKGVTLLAGTGAGNTIADPDLIFFNADLSIDLGDDGITLNHSPFITETGPNNYQNYPVLSSAVVSGGNTVVTGTLDSTPNMSFYLEFFGNTMTAPGGAGQGEVFLGSATVMTDAMGHASFSPTFPVVFGRFASATATASDGSTSEFSLAEPIAVSIGDGIAPLAGLSVAAGIPSPSAKLPSGHASVVLSSTVFGSEELGSAVRLLLNAEVLSAPRQFLGTFPTPNLRQAATIIPPALSAANETPKQPSNQAVDRLFALFSAPDNVLPYAASSLFGPDILEVALALSRHDR